MNVLKVAINLIHVYNKINGLFGNYDNKTQGFRVELQVSGGRGTRLGTRQGQDMDKTETSQGQDKEKTGTR